MHIKHSRLKLPSPNPDTIHKILIMNGTNTALIMSNRNTTLITTRDLPSRLLLLENLRMQSGRLLILMRQVRENS